MKLDSNIHTRQDCGGYDANAMLCNAKSNKGPTEQVNFLNGEAESRRSSCHPLPEVPYGSGFASP